MHFLRTQALSRTVPLGQRSRSDYSGRQVLAFCCRSWMRLHAMSGRAPLRGNDSLEIEPSHNGGDPLRLCAMTITIKRARIVVAFRSVFIVTDYGGLVALGEISQIRNIPDLHQIEPPSGHVPTDHDDNLPAFMAEMLATAIALSPSAPQFIAK
jgi:hypothetical protein